MYAQIFESLERTQGPDDPETLSAKRNLRLAYRYLGDYATARDLSAQLVETYVRTLGTDHPDTLTSKKSLSFDQSRHGDCAGAVSTLSQIVEAEERILGHDHPRTLETRETLAYQLWNLGDYSAALSMLSNVAENVERTEGPYATFTLKNNMESSCSNSGTTQLPGTCLLSSFTSAKSGTLIRITHSLVSTKAILPWPCSLSVTTRRPETFMRVLSRSWSGFMVSRILRH
ncbi:MAG: tetratricopeptide repeat protein [Deltaproteobacteria bacterium]|nr:tetratricopeptide repeat protein [Deltaproteobacteria bacterium]